MKKPQFSAMVEKKRAFFISMGVLIFLACMYGILGSHGGLSTPFNQRQTSVKASLTAL